MTKLRNTIPWSNTDEHHAPAADDFRPTKSPGCVGQRPVSCGSNGGNRVGSGACRYGRVGNLPLPFTFPVLSPHLNTAE